MRCRLAITSARLFMMSARRALIVALFATSASAFSMDLAIIASIRSLFAAALASISAIPVEFCATIAALLSGVAFAGRRSPSSKLAFAAIYSALKATMAEFASMMPVLISMSLALIAASSSLTSKTAEFIAERCFKNASDAALSDAFMQFSSTSDCESWLARIAVLFANSSSVLEFAS